MTPIDFKEANKTFNHPIDLAESQVVSCRAYVGEVRNPASSVDGSQVIVTAWQPSPIELERINRGEPIFLSFLFHGLPPHFLSTSFEEATNPA